MNEFETPGAHRVHLPPQRCGSSVVLDDRRLGPNSTTLHYNAGRPVHRLGRAHRHGHRRVVQGLCGRRHAHGSGERPFHQRAARDLPARARRAESRGASGDARQRGAADDGFVERRDRGGAWRVLDSSSHRTRRTTAPPVARSRGSASSSSCSTCTGLSHGIGLEVHDPEQYYFTGKIAAGQRIHDRAGSVRAREYPRREIPDTPRNREIAARLTKAVDTYKNIGVRIEDDYIVTAERRGVDVAGSARAQ